MQRPRNRQGRGVSQADRGGRGGRGRGRGGVTWQFEPRNPLNVPNIGQVVPGGFVSIVLKADQPTGREVRGTIADVLTNGNHPRGIKVRLVDGRVGRVQRMVTEAEAKAGSDGLSGLGRNGEQGGGRIMPRPGTRTDHREVHKQMEDVPSSGYSLGDFLPADHPLRSQHAPSGLATETSGSSLSVCPVCGEFEGDEIAVSHHVNSHFE